MTTLRDAAEMALDVLEDSCYPRASMRDFNRYDDTIETLRKALADHSEQTLEMASPVAWIFTWYEIAKDRHVRRIIDCEERPNIPGYDLIPLYTHPPQRKPLSDGQIGRLCGKFDARHSVAVGIAREIEKAHGIGGKE